MILITLMGTNIFLSIMTLFYLRKLVKLYRQQQDDTHQIQEQDIHSLLNHRLLDLQHRKYSLQRKP